MRKLIRHISEHWSDGYGASYNPKRSDAIARVSVVSDLNEILIDIEERTGLAPELICTSAKGAEETLSYPQMQERLASVTRPQLILLGTGWGLADQVLERAEHRLAPVYGPGEYNHLSVRSAAAIILDRLFGKEEG